MFLKSTNKYCKADKTRVNYYRLCESYRDEYGQVRQRMVIGLGRLNELPDIDQKILLAQRINELVKGEPTIFWSGKNKKVEEFAQYFYSQIKSKKKLDVTSPMQDEVETVKINSLQNRDVREIGAESIGYQAFLQLGIDKYLSERNWNQEQIGLAATHIVSRAVYPASELKTVSWIKENSGICELTGYNQALVTKDKLYGISKRLYQEKEGLEKHLSRCTNELFNMEDKIILYDLTNTYFEGQMKNSKKAKFGKSKEKRSDAKLIVLAVVVNVEGFLKYSDIFEGNTSDPITLKMIIPKLNNQIGYMHNKPVVVMDAGIATEGNIQYLKGQGYPYLCVARSTLKDYKADPKDIPIKITDKKNQAIELQKVEKENDPDNYLWVKSQAKALKENSMHNQFAERFEQGIRAIANGILKKGGTKKLEKVWERIGKLKQKYPSVHNYYKIEIIDNGKGTATSLSYEKKEDILFDDKAGVYFLRTSLDWTDEKTIWTIYNAIREIEYTFRVLKTDLDLRPIFHKTDEASMAHLHLGLLAYWLVSTIRYQLKQKSYCHDWKEIVRVMNTQKLVTTSVEKENGDKIVIRQCSEPNAKAKDIYEMLGYKSIILKRKKSVWHTEIKNKNTISQNQAVNDP